MNILSGQRVDPTALARETTGLLRRVRNLGGGVSARQRQIDRRFGVTGCCAACAGGRVPITQIWVPATGSTSLGVDRIMAAGRRLPAAAVSAVFDCADIVSGPRHG
jgi:hypothetical protein